MGQTDHIYFGIFGHVYRSFAWPEEVVAWACTPDRIAYLELIERSKDDVATVHLMAARVIESTNNDRVWAIAHRIAQEPPNP